jgi:hypothetical protein
MTMVRVVWYQHRNALLALVAVLAVLAAGLVVVGWTGRTGHPVQLGLSLPIPYLGLFSVPLVVSAVFALTGMFLGAPLLGREYEQGTFRFAWTQGTGWMRWCAGQINLLGGLIVLTAAGIGELASWAMGPYGRPVPSSLWSYFLRSQVGTGPAVTAGWALLAFMLGVLAGVVLKRVTPAVAATAVTLIMLYGWYRLYTLRMFVGPAYRRPWWFPIALGPALVAVALLAGAVALWLVRSRGARTRGRRPEPE